MTRILYFLGGAWYLLLALASMGAFVDLQARPELYRFGSEAMGALYATRSSYIASLIFPLVYGLIGSAYCLSFRRRISPASTIMLLLGICGFYGTQIIAESRFP